MNNLAEAQETPLVDNTFEEYLNMKGENHSALKHIAVSPLHYQYMKDNAPKETASKRLGSVSHIVLLEPDLLDDCVVMPNFHRGMKSETAKTKGYAGGKQDALDWEAENAGRQIVEAADLEKAKRIVDNCWSKPYIREVLEIEAFKEASLQWVDIQTGIDCKCRFDFMSPAAGIGLDFKTTTDFYNFSRAIFKFHYHQAAAFYMDGACTRDVNIDAWWWLVAGTEDECDVALYEAKRSVIEEGRRKYRELLNTLRHCRDKDVWPGFQADPEYIDLPAYAYKEDY